MRVLLLSTAMVAFAVESTGIEAERTAHERAAVQAERDRLEAQFAAEHARCAERFGVTACQDEVQERRRAALGGPRAGALALDDAERRRRAAERRDALAQKQRRAMERPASASVAAQVASASVAAPSPARVLPDDTAASHSLAASAAAAAAAQRAAAARARQAAIQADRARVEARQAERARQGKGATPLPVPAASRAGAQ